MPRHLLSEKGTVPWLTLLQAVRETDELLTGLDRLRCGVLKDLRAYFVGRVETERGA